MSDDTWRERIENRLEQLERKVHELQKRPSSETKNSDLQSLVEQKGPNNYHELSLVVGYYFDQVQDETFTMDDLDDKFHELRWGSYSNHRQLKSDLLNNKDWIMEADQEDHFVLHKNGIEAFENGFD